MVQLHLYSMSRIGKCIETERWVFAKDCGREEKWLLMGMTFALGVMKMFDIGDGYIALEYTKIHWSLYFKELDFTVCLL